MDNNTAMRHPTIGRIVHYRISENDVERIEVERAKRGHVHCNRVFVGDIVPAIVVWPHKNDSNTFNGQAFLDGDDCLWLPSVAEGEGPGQWQWPPVV